MSLQLDDTIAALASAPGPAARGILRLSGPDVETIVARLLPGFAVSRRLPFRSPEMLPLRNSLSLPIDLHFWPTKRSYTGQPLAELHTVGSPPLLEEVLSRLHQNGARPARPGEFTLRAFLAGRVDLMQAEAVLGVIDAEDHAELETALQQLGGGLSGKIADVRSDLLDLLSDLEAGLDFVDEDIEFVERADVLRRLEAASGSLQQLADQAQSRLQSSGRMRVVLAGLPNAGKSCLFNALVGEEAAIVSAIKGTTRDTLRGDGDLGGLSVEWIDTAGWDQAKSALIQQAESHRAAQTREADLILYCRPADASADEKALDQSLWSEIENAGIPVVLANTKCDLASTDDPDPGAVSVSAVTGEGLERLKSALAQRLATHAGTSRQWIGSTASRCRGSLEEAIRALGEAHQAAMSALGDEIIAVEIHQALEHLGLILGTVFTDDILDRIFSKFCIGK